MCWRYILRGKLLRLRAGFDSADCWSALDRKTAVCPRLPAARGVLQLPGAALMRVCWCAVSLFSLQVFVAVLALTPPPMSRPVAVDCSCLWLRLSSAGVRGSISRRGYNGKGCWTPSRSCLLTPWSFGQLLVIDMGLICCLTFGYTWCWPNSKQL